MRLHQPLNADLDVYVSGMNIYLSAVILGVLSFIAESRDSAAEMSAKATLVQESAEDVFQLKQMRG